MSDPLDIKNEMIQFDRKNRNFYDSLTDEQKKKFATFLMIRWGSSINSSNSDLQAYYLMSTNDRLNKNFFDINTTQHKKLQWLMSTTVSPGMGNQFHPWIAPKKKESANKTLKFLREMYPALREDEIQLLATVNTKDDLKAYARGLGWEDKKIKEYF